MNKDAMVRNKQGQPAKAADARTGDPVDIAPDGQHGEVEQKAACVARPDRTLTGFRDGLEDA